nr:LuxR family transcriptional regulator [Salsipaludibacter albus]
MVGRDAELARLRALVADLDRRGGALVLRGEAGIGKSALVSAAAESADARGATVLRATGVQAETRLPFAGLQQLLHPLRDGVAHLAAPQARALGAAFGQVDATPDLFLIALATLSLLTEAAATRPIVLVVDDAQWLDRPTGDVLAFVARRLERDRVLLLATVRTDRDSPLLHADLEVLTPGRLAGPAARALLSDVAPDLEPALATRVLAEAAGNPLALVELPRILTGFLERGEPVPAVLPLSERLERAFAARLADLPPRTREVVQIAALVPDGRLGDVLAAGRSLGDDRLDLAAVLPAVDAGLVVLDDDRVRFHHPLVRSAVHHATPEDVRRAAHLALASVLVDRPDRHAWHLAAGTTGPDDAVAKTLEEAAARAHRRGAVASSVEALRRAADLSTTRTERARRLVAAAEEGLELGRPRMVTDLLAEAVALGLAPVEQARVALVREQAEPRVLPEGVRRALLGAVDTAAGSGDHELALDLMWLVALRTWWADPGATARAEVVEVARRLGPVDDPRVVVSLAVADPPTHGELVARAIRVDAAQLDDRVGPRQLLGTAAVATGSFVEGAALLGDVAATLRDRGRLGQLPRVLFLTAWGELHRGDWETARGLADEAVTLAAETNDPVWGAAGRIVGAYVAALHGDGAEATRMVDDAEPVLVAHGISFLLSSVQMVRAAAATADGDHVGACEQLTRLVTPGDPSCHPFIAGWAVADLVDAALHADRRSVVLPVLADQHTIHRDDPSPWMRAVLALADALVAPDATADDAFTAALAGPVATWPFLRARTQLAHGTWLRRMRRTSESRGPLRTARETFDALGARPWSERARIELRAAGVASTTPARSVLDDLSSQELQVARMAASGLSNRQIGERLYLSHRTIGSHLYRIFPRLGITSRTQLRDVLATHDGPTDVQSTD